MSRVVAGKTQSRYLTAAQAELARQQVAAGQEFRQRLETTWAACERWADAELERSALGEEEPRKKNGSAKRSKGRSSRRSKR